jgi:ABC-type branched-subunit amino acid transport system ATPase component
VTILEIKNLTKKFGGITAVDNCSFKIEEKLVYGLIGPNGSGKTTIFNLITGIYDEDAGDVYFRGERLNGLQMYKRIRKGIGRTFQLLRIFRGMTVIGNLLVPPQRAKEKGDSMVEKALELLKFVDLINLRDEYAGNLSFGQQRLLEFAMVLMQDPELILLDEPTSGVNPALIRKMCDYIKKLRERGKTFVIVEHNIPAIMELCDRIIVLDYGKKIAEGSGEEISRDEKVIEAYLGAGGEVGG